MKSWTGSLPKSNGAIDLSDTQLACRADGLDAAVENPAGRRLEALFLARTRLAYDDWRKSYADDPDNSVLVRRLIWSFGKGEGCDNGMLTGKGIRGLQDQELEAVDSGTQVSLWHPAKASREEVLAWRRHLQSANLSQPFQQAHRQTFAMTDSDRRTRTYTNRFAAQILRQNRLYEVCRQNGWTYALQGLRDSFNVPTLNLEGWSISAELWVEPVDAESQGEQTSFPFLTTDQVCFRDHDGERLPLEGVPAVVFSEVMRDIDRIVALASVANEGV